MSAAALTPRVRMMTLCDRVRESRIEAGVFDLKGVRQSFSAIEFPYVPRRLWLFLVLMSPRKGDFPCYVRIVNDRTERTVFYTYLRPTPRFESDHQIVPYHLPLRCKFPEAGRYSVQVYFFQESQADVLKGELSFFVASSESP